MRNLKAHILIVEDDPVTRTKLAAYFSQEGYRVSEAEDGAEMRRILAERPADLIMLDINLPGEDGLQLTREQREKSEIGIILVTGRTDSIDRIVGLKEAAVSVKQEQSSSSTIGHSIYRIGPFRQMTAIFRTSPEQSSRH